ncbi:DUF1232 domain-containing protein [Fulvivirga sp. 29W222]|uniref:DUF1232 domain-containing protein n=1 Tax=Fulvivirga marina TaxID=2494733 RepID=A0A937FX72_9BACT|nr:DUF1232 domain-containing protein [Fulvivirga marina]MBL6446040.1 DUF1232 domain-containing protein [Fulvivirga marina]
MEQVTKPITDYNHSENEGVSEEKSSGQLTLGKVLESRAFSMAMKVAEKYTYSKSNVYRLLQHAFEKLKQESTRHRLQRDLKEKSQILMRMVKAYYYGDYRKIPATAVLRILGGFVYFVWILDLVPDFIPILGLADDLAVIVWVYNGLNREIEDFERWESAYTEVIDEV